MLSLLHIENIAVIDRADISFDQGFNVLTGETGAGKSIVIDAMNMSVVVGTLAGDDTVMIVMRDNNAAAAFCGEIQNLLM